MRSMRVSRSRRLERQRRGRDASCISSARLAALQVRRGLAASHFPGPGGHSITAVRRSRASKGRDSSRTITASKRARIIGFPGRSEEAVIRYMAAARRSRSMTMRANSMGERSGDSRTEFMRSWPDPTRLQRVTVRQIAGWLAKIALTILGLVGAIVALAIYPFVHNQYVHPLGRLALSVRKGQSCATAQAAFARYAKEHANPDLSSTLRCSIGTFLANGRFRRPAAPSSTISACSMTSSSVCAARRKETSLRSCLSETDWLLTGGAPGPRRHALDISWPDARILCRRGARPAGGMHCERTTF